MIISTDRIFAVVPWLAIVAPLGAEDPTVRGSLQGHTNRVVSAAFCLDGKKLVSRSADGTTRLWDLATGKDAVVGDKGWTSPTLTVMAGGKTLVDLNLSGGSLRITDLSSGKSAITKREYFLTLAFSPDGTIQVVMDGAGVLKLRELVTAFDASAGKIRKIRATLTGATGAAGKNHGMAFSPDGKYLAIIDKSEHVMLWDVASGTNTTTLSNTIAGRFAFNPDGKTLFAECGHKDKLFHLTDASIKLFDVVSGKEIATVEMGRGENADNYRFLAFSPDGKLLVHDSVYWIKVWDAATGKSIRTMEKSPGQLGPPVTVSPDGKIVTAQCGWSTRLWDVASGKLTSTLKGEEFLAFSSDGTTLATADAKGTIKLWTLPGAKEGGK